MSGGSWGYDQYAIDRIADDIQSELDRQGKEKDKAELWMGREYYEEYPEEKVYQTYPLEIQEKFKEGIAILRKAAIYAQRIDWLLSGDDGEETFLSRLKKDLEKCK